MNRPRLAILIVAVVLIGGLAGYWVAHSAARPAVEAASTDPLPPVPPRPRPDSPVREPKTERGPGARFTEDKEAIDSGAIANQRSLTFASAEAMADFLKKIEGKGFAVLDRIDALNTLRVGFLSLDDLKALLDGSEQLGMIFPAYIPGQGTVQDGAVGFGDQFLDWLGVDGDRSKYGSHVKVAVLDTGIALLDLFAGGVRATNYVELPSDLSLMNSHGTSVASIIASQLGLAPDAQLLDYRVANDNGVSNTFTLAKAVLDAVNNGANIINMSLGSRGFSLVLENALQVAYESGVVVVVSTGNEGLDSVSYPASSDYTVAVGAVEARGDHLDFSNSGAVSIVAPGLALQSYDQNGDPVYFSGTSAAAPTVSAAIALVMTTFNVNAAEAWQLISANANETGAPGYDADNGEGILNVGRTLDSKTSGITDLAVASNYVTTDSQGNPVVQVTVENRGTTPVTNAPVSVTTPAGTSQASASYLGPGDIKTFTFPVGANDGNYAIQSSIAVSVGIVDSNPQDNQRVDSFASSPSP
ncbi:S8 family peptidase [Haloferula sargassicola]|uniref:Peptidase S8/S53 domain-containing protein n=1 Tax=Haloferula sargassicola TaxID=490096 RepID=A0ABP9UVB1_9BACT